MQSIFKCKIYIRVSTPGQADPTKSSLDNQLGECRKVIANNEWEEVGNYYKDIESSQDMERIPRKGLDAMLAEADNGAFNLLVIYDFDRLSRIQEDSAIIRRRLLLKGIQTYSVNQPLNPDPPDNINYYDDMKALVYGVSAMKSTLDVNSLRRKYWDGMKAKVVSGELPHPASPPYGYDSRIKEVVSWGKGKRRIIWEVFIDEPKAKVVRRIYNDYLSGKSFRAIARELTDDGIPTPKGKKWWNYTTVELILGNPVYAGRVRWQWKKTKVPKGRQIKQAKDQWFMNNNGKHPYIIEPKKFDAVQRLIASKYKMVGRFSQGKYLLSGIIRCKHCGKKMWGTPKTTTSQPYYVCATWHQFRKCVSNFASMDEVDGIVIKNLFEILNNKEKFIEVFQDSLNNNNDLVDALELEKEILVELEEQASRIRLAMRKGMPPEEGSKALLEIVEEKKPHQNKIFELQTQMDNRKSASDVIEKIKDIGDIKKHYKENKPKLRTYLLDLLDLVEVTKVGEGKHDYRLSFKKF